MSAASPIDQEPALFAFEITADGQPIDSAIQVMSIDTWSAVNRIPRARVVLQDGSPADRTFPVSDAATFLPGAAVTIAAGYGGSKQTIFSGIVTAQSIDIRRSAAPTLVVDMADKAVKMTVARNTAVFEEMSDSDMMAKLLSASGLAHEIAATTTTHPSMVQFSASDWDTILYRAEMNGMVVTTEAGKVTIGAPDTSKDAALRVAFGESLIDMQIEMDAVGQLSKSAVKSYAWDASTQALLDAGPSGANLTEPGNVSSDTLAQVCNAAAFAQLTGGLVTKADLQSWSSARLARAQLAKIRGRVRFQGSALAKPGTMIQLAGVGKRFEGKIFVSAVHHEIRHNRWQTDAELGLAAEWFANRVALSTAGAAGHLPPIKGLHTGVVQKIAEDPDGQFRVQVTLPLAVDAGPVWARLSTWYASTSAGVVWFPEIDDEVIVAFMNEDPRFPVILGSVYSSQHAPPKTPDQKNNTKSFVSREKMELTFDEEKKAIVLKTPGGHTVTLSDDSPGTITIVDSHKNGITLDDNGITLDSASNIAIKAKGNISVTATGNLAMKANGNADVEGTQLTLKAQAALSAQGTASAELKASGPVTVKGAVVMIN